MELTYQQYDEELALSRQSSDRQYPSQAPIQPAKPDTRLRMASYVICSKG